MAIFENKRFFNMEPFGNIEKENEHLK